MIRLSVPQIGSEEIEAATAVLRSGMLVQGPEVAAFEDEFSHLVGERTCVAVDSGTGALLLSLLALGIGAGDEVVVPSFTFAATANAVRLCGAEVIFAEIDPETYCLDPKAVAAALTPRTAAIVPVHLYGHPAAMRELSELAERHSLAVIEDAAQAHGASLDGRPLGSWGTAAAFSFYATKNMTTGEGGMLTFADPSHARRARLLRNQGMEARYQNEIVGYNMRMTDIAAAIGRVQLKRLHGFNTARQSHAEALTQGLSEHVKTPVVCPGATHVYHQYVIRVNQRDIVQERLAELGVGSDVHYPTGVHRLPSYARGEDLPATDLAARQVLSVPVGPHLSASDLDQVISAVVRVVGS